MAKYDIENLLDGLKTFLVSNLNTQIGLLNAEKNDGITLKTVDSTAYHLQFPEDRAELSDPFIIYEEADEPKIEAMGGLVGTTHRVGITLVLADSGQDTKIVRRLFRYRRAILDLALSQWATMVGSHKFEIAAWSPSPPFKDMNGDFRGRAVGVFLTVAIAD